MSWKNLALPVQSLIFGTAAALVVWMLSPYLPSRHSCVPRDTAGAQRGAGNQFGREPYGAFGRRPGVQNLLDEGR